MVSDFVLRLLGDRYRAGSVPPLLPRQLRVREAVLAADRDGDWEHADCLCGARGGHVLTQVDRHGLPYRKVVCTRCGLLRVTPRWTAQRYAKFYAEQYRDLYSPPVGEDQQQEALRQLARGPAATMVSQFVTSSWAHHGDGTRKHPTVVEIGAGGGWNLAQLPPEWTRIGFDSDERFLQLGRQVFGVDLRRGFFHEALAAAATADCVLLSHVLEHVADPVALLRDLANTARPDALILIEVPGIFRLHRSSLDPMRYWQNAHTYTFSARTAVDTCRRAGLEPLAADDWIRLVLRPNHRYHGAIVNDAAIATSTERYLRFCEFAAACSRALSRWPMVGAATARTVRLTADALVRIAGRLGLIRGLRAVPLERSPS